MDCEYFRELISCLIDGELSKDEEAALADHLETCPECAAIYHAFSQLSAIVAEDTEGAPENLCANVMAELRRAEIVKKNRRKSAIKAVLATAACAVFVIAAGRLGGFKTGSTVNESAVVYDMQTAAVESYAAPADMPAEAANGAVMFMAPAAPAAMAEPEAMEESADISMDSFSIRQANTMADGAMVEVEAHDWAELSQLLNGQPVSGEPALPDTPVLSLTVLHEGVYYSLSFFELDSMLYYFDPIEGVLKSSLVSLENLANF